MHSTLELSRAYNRIRQHQIQFLYERIFSDLLRAFKHVSTISIRDHLAKLVKEMSKTCSIISVSIFDVRDFILRCIKALKGSAQWAAHLPKAIIISISRFIDRVGQILNDAGSWVINAVCLILRAAKVGLLSILSIALLVLVAKVLLAVHRKYEANKQEQMRKTLAEEHRKKRVEEHTRYREGMARREREEEARRRREEELRRKREEQEAQKRNHIIEDEMKIFGRWLAQSEALLACKEEMTRFPDPPFWPCATGCPESGILKACKHSIRKLYLASGAELKCLLQSERARWHPDRFVRCPEPSREVIMAKATEIFKIVDAWWKEEQANFS